VTVCHRLSSSHCSESFYELHKGAPIPLQGLQCCQLQQRYRVSFKKCKQAPEAEGTAATCSHFTAPVWVSLPLLPV